jgi:hypothetical protein
MRICLALPSMLSFFRMYYEAIYVETCSESYIVSELFRQYTNDSTLHVEKQFHVAIRFCNN